MSDNTAELETEPGSAEPENESGKMSFLEHLDELRKRLVHIIAYLFGGFIIACFFAKTIYNFLAAPLQKLLPPGQKLVYLDITAPFTVYMKVAFLAAIFITIPLTLYEVWKFIAPGLYRKEKKYIVPFLTSSVVLFLLGAAFCYIFVLPATFGVLLNLGSSFTPEIRIDGYLDLTDMMLLGFGMIFEMPVIASFLSIFGLISASFLWNKFKYAIVIIVALAAIISPTGDAFNLMVWSAPMILLYIISIGAAAIFGWNRKKKKRLSE
jgi:sec-independent protein translocase protein TatC